jgi:hypothetical protein
VRPRHLRLLSREASRWEGGTGMSQEGTHHAGVKATAGVPAEPHAGLGATARLLVDRESRPTRRRTCCRGAISAGSRENTNAGSSPPTPGPSHEAPADGCRDLYASVENRVAGTRMAGDSSGPFPSMSGGLMHRPT